MTPVTSHLAAARPLSAPAKQVLDFLRGERIRWIVLGHARALGAAGLDDREFCSAIEELEAADLVKLAAYGPLLYIR